MSALAFTACRAAPDPDPDPPPRDAQVASPDRAASTDSAPSPDTGPRPSSPPTLWRVGEADDHPFIEITDVLVDGTRGYVCTAVRGLQTYDLSNPAAMKNVGTERTLIRCQNLALDGTRLYAAAHSDAISKSGSALAAFDVRDLRSPRHDLSLRLPGVEFEGLAAHNRVVYVAAHDRGLYVVKHLGSSLRVRGTLRAGLSNAWDVARRGTHVFIADGPGGLRIVDVAVPSAPRLVATVKLTGFARRVDIDGDRAYVALGADGLAVVDVKDPRRPTFLGAASTPYSVLDVAAENGIVFAANWNDVRAFDATGAGPPVLVGATVLPPPNVSPFTRNLAIDARGDTAFVGEWQGLQSVRYREGAVPIVRTAVRDVLFPVLAVGTSGAFALRIANDGRRPLSVAASTDTSAARVVPPTLTLAPGKADVVEVRYTATTAIRSDALVTLSTNDPSRPRVQLPIAANVGGLTPGMRHPDFDLFDTVGKRYRRDALAGKVVLLAYFATF